MYPNLYFAFHEVVYLKFIAHYYKTFRYRDVFCKQKSNPISVVKIYYVSNSFSCLETIENISY